MTKEEAILWLNEEIRTWENECQSKHPIKEALYEACKALEQEPCNDAVSVASVFEIMGNLMSIPYDFDRSITEKDVSESMDKVRELPRVTPQEPRIGKLIGYIDFLRNTAQGKRKSLNLLEKVVKGELEEIRTEGENFVEPRTGEWIPMVRREPTDEEKAEYLAQSGEELCYMFENEMPLGGQEVLVSSSGYVSEDVFDEDFYNFENQDIENVDAWMPLPQPYKAESEDEG